MSPSADTLPANLVEAVARARAAEPSATTALISLRLMDLTNLDETADAEVIDTLCRRAVSGPEPVAAVCLYPPWIARAREALAASPVRVATVANFPHPTAPPEAVSRAVTEAVGAGAHEVDLVLPHAAVRAGDAAAAAAVVSAGRQAAGPGTCFKVIVESGAFDQAETLTTACRIAVDNGADFLKTSTGKVGPGASLEAAAVLLDVASAAGRPVGVKVSGGIRTTADAARYLALAGDLAFAGRMMANGPAFDRFTPAGFRIGASSLMDDLLALLAESPDGP